MPKKRADQPRRARRRAKRASPLAGVGASESPIGASSFFRDPEVFAALETDLFPQLLENRLPGTPLRVWVPGCSTGEEVYSLAFSLQEFLDERGNTSAIKLFGTDTSENCLAAARASTARTLPPLSRPNSGARPVQTGSLDTAGLSFQG
jgi:hypothetical protein